MIVERRSTPIAAEEASKLLGAAYRVLTGVVPTGRILALLLAQWGLETGQGQLMLNNNFGFVKGSPSYPTTFQAKDDCGPDECLFRAYERAEDGALDYVKVLRNRPHWWAGLHTESPEGFNRALSTPPVYYTAPPEKYGKTLRELYDKFLPLAEAALAAPALAS